MFNYVYRKSVYYNNKFSSSDELPKFDIIEFLINYYNEKDQNEINEIQNLNMFKKENRAFYLENNDEKWLSHCYEMAYLFNKNKKEYFKQLNEEKQYFLSLLGPIVSGKKDFYLNLKNEITDYYKRTFKLLYNNEKFKALCKWENFYKYYDEIEKLNSFNAKLTDFLNKNDKEDYNRCPHCVVFSDDIYEHLFKYCNEFLKK